MTALKQSEYSLEDIQREKAECEYGELLLDILEKYYPGYGWHITTDFQAQSVAIYAKALSGKWGMLWHIPKLEVGGPRGRKKILVQVAGELLERYKVSRGPRKPGEVENIPLDHKLEKVADRS